MHPTPQLILSIGYRVIHVVVYNPVRNVYIAKIIWHNYLKVYPPRVWWDQPSQKLRWLLQLTREKTSEKHEVTKSPSVFHEFFLVFGVKPPKFLPRLIPPHKGRINTLGQIIGIDMIALCCFQKIQLKETQGSTLFFICLW